MRLETAPTVWGRGNLAPTVRYFSANYSHVSKNRQQNLVTSKNLKATRRAMNCTTTNLQVVVNG